jgi:hypothetical protein
VLEPSSTEKGGGDEVWSHGARGSVGALLCGEVGSGADEDITTLDTTTPSIEVQGPIMRS